ncbi:MAG: alkaline phosphatase family protein [Gammaproteobacteria bacterium]
MAINLRGVKRQALAMLGVATLTTFVGLNAANAGDDDHKKTPPPKRVLIVLFDQMIPKYADMFYMPNFRRLRDSGREFKEAYLGYMASETVIAHNVITSGKRPNHMGWVDEAYRDEANFFGKNVPGQPAAMHITGDFSLTDFGTLVNSENYPKLADYLHTAYPGTKFIVVGEKSYAVESATASTGDIAVRLSSRSSSSLHNECRDVILGGRYRFPAGKNVPTYLTDPFCGRWYINSDSGNDYGTKAAFPSWMYPEDGDRFFPGTSAASKAGHVGGDTWVADAAIVMMAQENWSGMFVTLGAIDKAAHMWGAQYDAVNFNGSCYTGTDAEIGAALTHVRCAAENADVQLGKLLNQLKIVDAARGGETLVVLTADHGATYGENFYGKNTSGAGDSNWYYAPYGVWDAGSGATEIDTTTYNSPSPALRRAR